MPDRDTWRFINTFAPWLAAIGTLSAVITSLYLGRRASRLDIRVFPAIVKMGVPGQPETWHEFLQIRVINHGRQGIVKGLQWWLRGTKQQWIMLPPDDPYSTKVPAKLDFGEEAMFLFPTASFGRLGKSLLQHIRDSRFPQLTVRLLRVGIYTSTGQTFRAAFDPPLRRFLLEQAQALPRAD